MAAFFLFVLVPLLFLAYGALCLIAPDKHLAFNAWVNLRRRRKWHELRHPTCEWSVAGASGRQLTCGDCA
jgi:hypothetical protein